MNIPPFSALVEGTIQNSRGSTLHFYLDSLISAFIYFVYITVSFLCFLEANEILFL